MCKWGMPRGGEGTNDVWPDTHVSSEGTLSGAESTKDLDAVGNNAQFLVGFEIIHILTKVSLSLTEALDPDHETSTYNVVTLVCLIWVALNGCCVAILAFDAFAASSVLVPAIPFAAVVCTSRPLPGPSSLIMTIRMESIDGRHQ